MAPGELLLLRPSWVPQAMGTLAPQAGDYSSELGVRGDRESFLCQGLPSNVQRTFHPPLVDVSHWFYCPKSRGEMGPGSP